MSRVIKSKTDNDCMSHTRPLRDSTYPGCWSHVYPTLSLYLPHMRPLFASGSMCAPCSASVPRFEYSADLIEQSDIVFTMGGDGDVSAGSHAHPAPQQTDRGHQQRPDPQRGTPAAAQAVLREHQRGGEETAGRESGARTGVGVVVGLEAPDEMQGYGEY